MTYSLRLGVTIMAKKNSNNGGNTPHIKGDELVQDINQQRVNLFADIANLNDDDIKPIDKYKRGEDIVMSAYANEMLQAGFEQGKWNPDLLMMLIEKYLMLFRYPKY